MLAVPPRRIVVLPDVLCGYEARENGRMVEESMSTIETDLSTTSVDRAFFASKLRSSACDEIIDAHGPVSDLAEMRDPGEWVVTHVRTTAGGTIEGRDERSFGDMVRC